MRTALVAIAGVLLAFVAVRAATIALLPATTPILAAITPHHPTLTLRQPILDGRSLNVAPAKLAAFKEASRHAPLAAEPYLIAAIDALNDRPTEAPPLVEEARHRNPRSRIARLLSLDIYLGKQDLGRAVPELGVLNRLLPQASPILLDELAKRASKPESRPALAALLAQNKDVRDALLDRMVREKGDPAVIAALAGSGVGFDQASARWQQEFVQSLIARGEYARARDTWFGFLGRPPSADKSNLLFNPAFRQDGPPPPFNWRFTADDKAVSEGHGDGSVSIEYFGSAPTDVLSQTLMLEPGNYRFSMVAQQSSGEQGGTIGWQLLCLPGDSTLMTLDLGQAGTGATTLSANISIPEPCRAQQLRLRGAPGEFPASISMTLRNLNLSEER